MRVKCKEFFQLLGRAPKSSSKAIDILVANELIIDDRQNRFDVTHLFALLAASDLSALPMLKNKAPRVVTYEGTSKIVGKEDVVGKLGYAVAFTRILRFIMRSVPQREEMRGGLRVTEHAYPEVAIRELLANALIHQDLSAATGGPFIEIFSDRLQITNPGAPIVPLDRLIDTRPAQGTNVWQKLCAT
jgi:ATP-dependent DNA helicase RecG